MRRLILPIVLVMFAQQAAAEVLVTVHYLDDFEQPQVVTQTLAVQV